MKARQAYLNILSSNQTSFLKAIRFLSGLGRRNHAHVHRASVLTSSVINSDNNGASVWNDVNQRMLLLEDAIELEQSEAILPVSGEVPLANR